MKNLLLLLTLGSVVALGIAGFVYFGTATDTSPYVTQDVRTPSLVAAITCLTLAAALLVFAIVVFSKRE